MSTDNRDDDYVVTAGYVTVETQVGAGRAHVDIPQGSPLPADVPAEQRTRLINAGAVGRRDGKGTEDTGDGVSDRLGRPVDRPVPGLVEPDEIDPDVVPAGAAEDVLAWVGDDLARARVALDMEQAKGLNARAGLITELESVMAGQETDPPAVPESLTDGPAGVSRAASGGVAVPDESASKPARRRSAKSN